MKSSRDLASASWTLTGYAPDAWRGIEGTDLGAPDFCSEIAPMPARVPASVQARDAVVASTADPQPGWQSQQPLPGR